MSDSRIEKLLKAILGQEVQLEPRESRVERLLYAILTGGSHDEPTLSEMEDILLCILHGERYEGPTNSRINALLKDKANGGSYDEPRLSRIEELIYEWINGGDISTYMGTLPATLRTVAGYLARYKMWGNTGGVGIETENLIDVTNVSDDGYLDSNGQICSSPNYHVSQYISVEPDTDYIYGTTFGTYVSNVCVVEYDDAYQFVKGTSFGSETSSMHLHTHTDTRYVRCSIRIVRQNTTYLIKGADELPEYIPYGYKLLILSNDTTTDIYIGDTALAKDEYVDSAGKIYKRTENLFDIKTFQDGMHLDITTGLPNPFGGNRIATMQPIDVSQYNSITVTYDEIAHSAAFMYSIFSGDTLIERVTGKKSGNTINTSNATKMYLSLYSCTTSDIIYIMGNAGSTPLPYEPYLTPTDPPAPLPQIATAVGETTISYGGAGVQPEKVELKYRK